MLCVQILSGPWLNPCEWGLRPPTVTIARGQRSASVTMELKKGVGVQIRVDDPGRRLIQHEGKSAGAHLLVGGNNDSFGFRPAEVKSQDANGRDYQVLIPYSAPVRLVRGRPAFS
jgi:hypothetical protein